MMRTFEGVLRSSEIFIHGAIAYQKSFLPKNDEYDAVTYIKRFLEIMTIDNIRGPNGIAEIWLQRNCLYQLLRHAKASDIVDTREAALQLARRSADADDVGHMKVS